MKILITENQYKKLKRFLTESEEEYYRISPQDYIKFLKKTNYDASIFESKKFNGLPLYVTSTLDLRGLPIESLGNVAYIDGNLDISNTLVKSLGKTKVKGHIWSSNSPLEKVNELKNEFKMFVENNQKRIDGKWSLLNENINEEGLAANALYQYLVREDILNGIDEDELNEYNEKIKEYSEFLEKFENLKDNISYDELENLEEEGNEILFQLSELNDRNKADVYFIIPKGLYGERVYRFNVIGLSSDREYFVGLDKFMYELAVEEQVNLLEGMDLEDYSTHAIINYLKEDEANEFIKDHFKDKIKENPEEYFTETDYQLTWQQENRKNNLESTIKELLSMPNNPDKKNTVKMSYMNQSGLIEFHEKTLEELQSEYNSIKPPTEPTEDMIDEKVDELTEELLEDDNKKIKFLQEKSSIDNFIDFDHWARDIVQYDGYGVLSTEGESGWFDETIETPTRRYNFHIIENNN